MTEDTVKEIRRFAIVLICAIIGAILIMEGHPIVGFICIISGIYSGIEEDEKNSEKE